MQTFTEEELAQKSQQFRTFYNSLQAFGDHQGPDIDTPALLALSGEERNLAETLLIQRIPTRPVIYALGDMKSERGAAILKEQIKDARGSTAVEMALALWRIEKWPRAQKVLIDVLEGRRKPDYKSEHLEAFARADAARALAYIPNPKTIRALIYALEDPDSHVQHWAQIALNVLRKQPVSSR